MINNTSTSKITTPYPTVSLSRRDKELWDKAKREARKQNMSLSRFIENCLLAILREEKDLPDLMGKL